MEVAGMDKNEVSQKLNHTIEAKKSTNGKGDAPDVEKLKAYKSNEHLNYEYAVFLVFRTGNEKPGVEPPKFI